MSLGIQEVKAVVKMGLAIGELVDSLSDGLSLSDLGPALRVAKSVKPAIDALKSGQLLPELEDLSDDEREELKQFVADEFDISNDSLEAAVEKGLQIAIDLSKLVEGL